MKIYAVNAATGGISEFSGWSPVVLLSNRNETIVAEGDGLYLRGGSDDNGYPVAWEVKTGATDDHTHHMKGIHREFLSFVATGVFALTIIGERRGKSVSCVKTVPLRGSGLLRDEPVKGCSGLTSIRFQRKLSGVAGSVRVQGWKSAVVKLGRTG